MEALGDPRLRQSRVKLQKRFCSFYRARQLREKITRGVCIAARNSLNQVVIPITQ